MNEFCERCGDWLDDDNLCSCTRSLSANRPLRDPITWKDAMLAISKLCDRVEDLEDAVLSLKAKEDV